MKKMILSLFCLSVISLPYAQSQENASIIELEATISGSPLIPSSSELKLSVPFGIVLDQEIFRNFSANAWYLAATPYLFPGKFFEFGTTLGYGFGKTSMHGYPLIINLGSAFSMNNGIISVPAILGVSSNINFIKNSSLNPNINILIYGEGIIAHVKITTGFAPFKNSLIIILGAEAMLAVSIKYSQSALSYGYIAGISYGFGGNK
ncbi:MAG: hypothetical protein CVU92_10660 [Firmicutes bacterium HGW-Firmicutes-17]|jgi:hypothetical protein|nr:MAG: hypothetical protein CVU92_10660 [Firmicutes bacterium HGW-Firmicutes-17]